MPTDPGLPWWMPAWFWRFSRTVWFGSIAVGIAAYFLLSLISDLTGGTIPLRFRLVALAGTAIIVRLGFTWNGRLERK